MSVSFNQPSQYPVSALNVKSGQKPDEAAKASFKGAPEGEEKEGMSTAAKVGIGAAVLGAAGLILYFTCGKGGSKAAEGAKDVAEKGKEAIDSAKKIVEKTIDDFKKEGNKIEKGIAKTGKGENYTGSFRTAEKNGKFSVNEYSDGVLTSSSQYEGEKLLGTKNFTYDNGLVSEIKLKDADGNLSGTINFSRTNGKLSQKVEKDASGNILKDMKFDRGANGAVSKMTLSGSSVGENRLIEHDFVTNGQYHVREFDTSSGTNVLLRDVQFVPGGLQVKKGGKPVITEMGGNVYTNEGVKLSSGAEGDAIINGQEQIYLITHGNDTFSYIRKAPDKYEITKNGNTIDLSTDEAKNILPSFNELFAEIDKMKADIHKLIKP